MADKDVEYRIEPGYYLYRGRLRFEVLPATLLVAAPEFPKGAQVTLKKRKATTRRTPGYDGHCRDLTEEQRAEQRAAGRGAWANVRAMPNRVKTFPFSPTGRANTSSSAWQSSVARCPS